MTHFVGLDVQLTRALALGYRVHSLHQEGNGWHCRLKLTSPASAVARYSWGDDQFAGDAVRRAIAKAEEILAWQPTLGTLTRLKALKPDLEALLKEI